MGVEQRSGRVQDQVDLARIIKQLFLSVINLLCLAYIVGLFVFTALRFSQFALPPLLNLLTSFGPFLFIPVLAIIIVALMARRRLLLACALAGALLFSILYGSLFLPQAPHQTSSVSRITVMTFNLGPGQGRPQDLVKAIEDENADIVAVQKLVPETAQALRQKLGARYPSNFLDLRFSTTGFLTRYPISKIEHLQPAGKGRTALAVTINVNNQIVNAFAVHPLPPNLSWLNDCPIPTGLDNKDQEDEITDIIERTRKLNSVIILGDFNMTDQTRSYSRLAGSFKDSYRETESGFGFTFPNNLRLNNITLPFPFLRLDYIFHSSDLRAEKARVSCKGSSDHCYLVAELDLKSP